MTEYLFDPEHDPEEDLEEADNVNEDVVDILIGLRDKINRVLARGDVDIDTAWDVLADSNHALDELEKSIDRD
jgi:hypothetical protein